MGRRLLVLRLLPLLVLLTALPPPAGAQDFGRKLEVGGNVSLGAAGESDPKINDAKQASDDMEVTAGMNLYAMYEVHRFVDVGGKFNFLFWRTDLMKKNAIDRMTWIEFDAVLRVKYDFLGDTLHLFLAMPLGVTIAIPNKDFKDKFVAGTKTGAGFNMSLVVGLSYMFWQGLGAFFDLGWVLHYTNNKAANNVELEATINQMAIDFGLFWRF